MYFSQNVASVYPRSVLIYSIMIAVVQFPITLTQKTIATDRNLI